MNPKTSSLQEVLIMYLKELGFYALKAKNLDCTINSAKTLILNTLSIMITNPEFSEQDFNNAITNFNTELPDIIRKYEEICQNKNITPEYAKTKLTDEKKSENIIDSIRQGEKEFTKKLKEQSDDIRNLFKILFILSKSLCVNVITLESYNKNADLGYEAILKILNFDEEESDKEKIKEFINEISKTDNQLMQEIISAQIERYGQPEESKVSYSTFPNKAVMVVGSNLRELENILNALKDEHIDVYTHDDMINAHVYPVFKEYKNLKGQFGQGYENCLLDFSTFPGPIILTKLSLFNVDHLYRGRLFTTDNSYSKGIIKIKNNDFADVIETAKDSRGFKTGKICESEIIGFDTEKLINLIEEKIKCETYSRVIIIESFTNESKEYIKNLIEKLPNNILIITLAPIQTKENVISVNSCFNTFSIISLVKRIDEILQKNFIPMTIFMPKCDRHTVSKAIYFNSIKNGNIYLGKCSPLILDPSLMKTLKKMFKIKSMNKVKSDIENITENY